MSTAQQASLRGTLINRVLAGAPRRAGKGLCRLIARARSLLAFACISLGVIVTHFGRGRRVIFPLIMQQCHASGVSLMPIVTAVAFTLGLTVVGQALTFFSNLGALNLVGAILGSVVVRELGPLLAASLVLARAGTAIVVELGAARATGQIETLEQIGVDPIHYFVVPRLIGLSLSVFSITVYLTLFTLIAAYGVVLISDVALPVPEYVSQTVAALTWEDFVVVGLKALLFGFIIALVCCHEGLAKPITLADVPAAASNAVTQSVMLCLLVDAAFLLYLLKIFQ